MLSIPTAEQLNDKMRGFNEKKYIFYFNQIY